VRAKDKPPSRVLRAVHGIREIAPDPPYEIGLSDHLKSVYSRQGLIELYTRFTMGDGSLDKIMRRAIWRAAAKRFGNGVTIGTGVEFLHIETFEIGDGVFIGAHSYLQGRFDGSFVINDMVWIGPHSYFDGRDMVLESNVGWGPGAKVVGSQHTGQPLDVPVIRTDLEVKPVRVEAWADIGANSTLLPGVTVGKGSIVGAGAVVVEDVMPFSIVGGVPARFIRWREGYQPPESDKGQEHATSK
jgi:acetyltransferase-like isoleucine patch superfamily enzyme